MAEVNKNRRGGINTAQRNERSNDLPPRNSSRRRIPTLKAAILSNARVRGSGSGPDDCDGGARSSPATSSQRGRQELDNEAADNGDTRSDDRMAGNGSQQEEASSMLQTIISSAIPVPRLNDNEEQVAPTMNEKDRKINELKSEVANLKEERKRLLEHIEVLGALRKEYEGKIKDMEFVKRRSVLAGVKRKRRKSTSDPNSKELRDLCVIATSRYSRVQENVATNFTSRIREKSYPVEIVSVLEIIFTRMNRIARLFVNEINFRAFIDGSNVVFGTENSVSEEGFDILYDWNTVCSRRGDDLNNTGFDPVMVVFETENISGEDKYIMKNPSERLREAPFHSEDICNIVRCIVDQGYLYLRLEHMDSLSIAKSEFKDIVEECSDIHQRLLHCCRYNLSNKKKATKFLYLKQLGYFTDKGDLVCQCGPSTPPVEDENGGTVCVRQVECVDCVNTRRRLNRRRPNGSLVVNWWRKGTHSELGRPGSVEDRGHQVDNASFSKSYHLFRNNAAVSTYRKFFEYEGPDAIQHDYCTSIVNIVRLDARMAVMLAHSQKRGLQALKGGNNVHRMMSDYESLKMCAYRQLQEEIIRSVEDGIQEEGGDVEEFRKELGIPEVSRNENEDEYREDAILQRKYTSVTVFDSEAPVYYYICILPSVFRKYICSWIGDMKDCYVGRIKAGDTTLARI